MVAVVRLSVRWGDAGGIGAMTTRRIRYLALTALIWAPVALACDPPNGALHLLNGFGLTELEFDCIPLPRSMCGAHFCTKFIGRSGSAHVYGYIWRDSFNGLLTTFCSPDGGWPGGWDGECPEGTAIDNEKDLAKKLLAHPKE